MSVRIQLRRDTAANWTSTNPTLTQGEPGYETDTGKIKYGDGTTAWNSLAYSAGDAFAAGSALSPSITFNGDTNTGIYSPGADQLALATNGTGRLFVDSSGNVGIGVTSPAAKLHIADDTGRLRFTNAGGTGTAGVDYYANAVERGYIRMDFSTGALAVGTVPSWPITFTTNSTERLRITSDGKVGIGTTNPPNKLSVLQGEKINFCALSNGSAYGYITGDNSNNLAFGYGTTETARIDSSGRLGIGTTSPDSILTISDSSANGFKALQVIATGAASDAGIRLKGASGGGFRLQQPTGLNGIFFYDEAASAERARIDSSGRLLVGTSSSFQNNSLVQVSKSSGNAGIAINSASLSNGTGSFFQVRGTVSALRYNELGVFVHPGISEACGYLMQMSQNGVAYFTWVDDSSQYRISSASSNVGTTSGTVIGTQTSDERIKNILGPVTYGLETLKQIEPVRYVLKSAPDTEKLGFIAQQVLPLVPQSVFDTGEQIEGEPEGAPTKLGMEYVALIPVLVNAIKELSAEVDALKAQLQAS